jgi:signal transduction histidine kinase
MSGVGIFFEFLEEKVFLAAFIFLIFLRAGEKRKHFILRCLLLAVGIVILGLTPRLLYENGIAVPILSYWLEAELFVWPMMLGLGMLLLFRGGWNLVVFSALSGLCTMEASFAIDAIISILFPSLNGTPWENVVAPVVEIGTGVFLYYFLARRLTPQNLQMLEKRSLSLLVTLYVFSVAIVFVNSYLVLTFLIFYGPIKESFAQSNLPLDADLLRLYGVLAGFAGNILVLLALRTALSFTESQMEGEMLKRIREEDRKQYERFRNNVDYINTKSHDLHHYLELITKNQQIPSEELQRVSESLQHLDSETDSSNDTLDLILTDRKQLCATKEIDFNFQTDGTPLTALGVMDIYTIFCNLLDNAIEHVEKLPKEDRRIRLGIKSFNQMIFIHLENPMQGNIEMADGLPLTTQQNHLLHGYGLKSVKESVTKCGGELIVKAENNIFEVDLYFPNKG